MYSLASSSSNSVTNYMEFNLLSCAYTFVHSHMVSNNFIVSEEAVNKVHAFMKITF